MFLKRERSEKKISCEEKILLISIFQEMRNLLQLLARTIFLRSEHSEHFVFFPYKHLHILSRPVH